MIINKKKIGIIIGIVIVTMAMLALAYPCLFKKNHIEKITKLELPKAAPILDCKFFLDSYGIQLKYAKVEIDQNTYDSIDTPAVSAMYDFLQHVVTNKNYKSLNLENVEEMKCGEIMESKVSVIGGATTRVTYYIAVKEGMGKYYLYILSY